MQIEETYKEIKLEKRRQKPPNFDIEIDASTKIYILLHLSWFLIILYFVLKTDPSEFVNAFRSWREGAAVLIFFCIFLLYPLINVWVGIREIADHMPMLIKKIKWIKGAARTKATIVDRSVTVDHTESDEYNTWNIYTHELRLRYTPAKAISNSSEQTIWALVDQRIYDKYERRKAAHIYYSRTDPSIFFIKYE